MRFLISVTAPIIRAWIRFPVAGLSVGAWLFFVAGVGAPVRLGLDRAQEHWAFQPVSRPQVPRIHRSDQQPNPVDAFLLARLETNQLSFASAADRRTWLRRVTFDLTGLPPTMADAAAFDSDRSAQASERVVDRLLASPQYGERWGRHWLDVARYADTKDLVLLYGRDALRPWAYTYRDYVIRAFNEDLPYTEFIVDQLAADLVQPPREPWRLAALGFLTLGRLFDNNPHDQIDDQIDTTTRGLLGLTVACARCHDHKYDPIGTDDYYSLYGIFSANEQPYVLPLIEDPTQVLDGPAFEAKLAKAQDELERHIDAEYVKQTDLFRRRLGAYLTRAATTQPDLWETAQFGLSLVTDDFRPALMRRTRQLLALRVQPSDRIFGPWARLMALPADSFSTQAPELVRNLKANCNPLVVAALLGSSLTNREAIPGVYGRLLFQLDVHQRGTNYAGTNAPLPVLPSEMMATSGRTDRAELLALFDGPQSPLGFPRRETPDHMSRPDKDRYGSMVLGLDKLAAHATNRPPARAMVLSELPDPPIPRIFQRGSPSRLGEPVARALPRVLTGGIVQPFRHGSGRLELAQGIASTTNPLTARVWVNRVWMHHFGDPLVNSPADFGSRSEPPVQRELMDWLASEFTRGGSRLKPLHRMLVLSAAYRQGNSNPAAKLRDPENRLLGWFPRRRLDLEAMRDSLLAISGRMDSQVGGPPTGSPTSPSNLRRTVYSLIDRQNLPGLFRAFDFAAPDQCAERRPQTMVPQQALFAMNSPFVLELADAVSADTNLPGIDNPERLKGLFQRVLGRLPTPAETRSAWQFLGVTGEMGSPTTSTGGRAGAWTQLAQVLLISNEAVFVD